MIQTIDALAQGAIELPPDQRFALAQRILASMEPEEAAEIDDPWGWNIELLERIARDPQGFILNQGWASVSLEGERGLKELEQEIEELKAEAELVAEEARELAAEVPF
jgi:hypothetical protein